MEDVPQGWFDAGSAWEPVSLQADVVQHPPGLAPPCGLRGTAASWAVASPSRSWEKGGWFGRLS